jgi:hypothetical protein
LLLNPNSPVAEALSRDLQAAAGGLGLNLHVLRVGSDQDFATVFSTLKQLRAEGLVIGTDPFFNGHAERIAPPAPAIISNPASTIFLIHLRASYGVARAMSSSMSSRVDVGKQRHGELQRRPSAVAIVPGEAGRRMLAQVKPGVERPLFCALADCHFAWRLAAIEALNHGCPPTGAPKRIVQVVR